MSHSVRLAVIDGMPAWAVRVVQPDRFSEVRCILEPRVFKLPQGALFAVNLQLFDVPEQPYFIHRVLDLSDPEVVAHLDLCGRTGRLVIAFDTVGQAVGYNRTLELDGGRWQLLLKEGQAFNATVQVQGQASLDAFLEVFLPVSRERGVKAGWGAVGERYPAP
ncbi:MAG: hypothetical protein HY748_14370 [Elusimicrobia bacterium]|nr:hypothetical protein [Elusimicrobiota bacterium]